MNYWLVKSEPGTYSWENLIKDGRTSWDGVRNYQARNNLKEMKKGDTVLFYHSNDGMEIVGIARVSKESYQDPTIDDERWVAVEIEPVKKLKKSVTLQTVKNDTRLKEMALVRTSRLSVMPLKKEEFDIVMELAG
jgi:predicted RNA-binding protein with PUA-like domain